MIFEFRKMLNEEFDPDSAYTYFVLDHFTGPKSQEELDQLQVDTKRKWFNPLKVRDIGPGVVHNMPCSVCWDSKAVLDLNTGMFQPCWTCQSKGYILKKRWFKK